VNEAAIWHELECWGYDADIPLWHELADEYGGPIVDLGAGTGRVSLDLAAAGHEVIAVDLDPLLLAEIAVHGPGLPIRTVAADIREPALDEPVPLVIVPMQTVQLLGGADGRHAMLAAMRPVVARGGALAVAIAEDVEAYEADEQIPFVVCERDGMRFESDPFAITEDGDAHVLHHARVRHAADGTRTATVHLTRLDRLDAGTFEAEGTRAGFTVLARRYIEETDAHVGSAVVMLGG
jgi:SAM-dependent methyltransferase